MDFANFDSVCCVCGQVELPGEIHFTCSYNPAITSDKQCIYCLADERNGDHSECQERIAKFRYELINFFKG
jgi:hypothetical protein